MKFIDEFRQDLNFNFSLEEELGRYQDSKDQGDFQGMLIALKYIQNYLLYQGDEKSIQKFLNAEYDFILDCFDEYVIEQKIKDDNNPYISKQGAIDNYCSNFAELFPLLQLKGDKSTIYHYFDKFMKAQMTLSKAPFYLPYYCYALAKKPEHIEYIKKRTVRKSWQSTVGVIKDLVILLLDNKIKEFQKLALEYATRFQELESRESDAVNDYHEYLSWLLHIAKWRGKTVAVPHISVPEFVGGLGKVEHYPRIDRKNLKDNELAVSLPNVESFDKCHIQTKQIYITFSHNKLVTCDQFECYLENNYIYFRFLKRGAFKLDFYDETAKVDKLFKEMTVATSANGKITNIRERDIEEKTIKKPMALPEEIIKNLENPEKTQSLLALIANNDPTLKEVSFCGENIKDAGIKFCAELLKENNVVENIDFQDTSITDAGLKRITDMLCQNETITTITLRKNPITNKGLEDLLLKTTTRKTPIYLNLWECEVKAYESSYGKNIVTKADIARLAYAFAQNSSVQASFNEVEKLEKLAKVLALIMEYKNADSKASEKIAGKYEKTCNTKWYQKLLNDKDEFNDSEYKDFYRILDAYFLLLSRKPAQARKKIMQVTEFKNAPQTADILELIKREEAYNGLGVIE